MLDLYWLQKPWNFLFAEAYVTIEEQGGIGEKSKIVHKETEVIKKSLRIAKVGYEQALI